MPARGCSCLGCSGYVLEGRQDWGCLGEPSTWGVLASAFLEAAAAAELRIRREKQGWEGAKPFQNLGRNRREQHHAWVPLAPQTVPGRRVVAVSSMDTSSWPAQGEGSSGEGRKRASPRCW